MELNSCHCSDSSRAERRGSERDSEQRTAGTERASERARERGGEREGGRSEERRARPASPGADTGCRSLRRGATSLSASLSLEPHGHCPAGAIRAAGPALAALS